MLRTPGASITENFALRLTTSRRQFGFGVRACESATVSLMNGGRNSNLLYKINIGVGNNTLTQVADRYGNALRETFTPDILRCDKDMYFVVRVSYSEIFTASHFTN